MTRQEAKKEALEIYNNGIDLEDGETKKDWIECYIEALEEDCGGFENE